MVEKSLRRGLAALVVGWALLGAGVSLGFAADEGCGDTCGEARRGCEMAVRAAYTGCKQVCRESDSRRECRRVCSDTFETAKDACDAAREECRQVCGAPVDPAALSGAEPLPGDPPAPGEEALPGDAPADPGTCVAGCRDEIKSCVEEVVALGRECVGACLDGQRAAGLECLETDRPGRCLAAIAGEAGHCLGDCADLWHAAGEGCREVLHVCRESCGSPVDLPDADDDSDDDSGDDHGDDDGDDDSDDDADDDHGGSYGSARRAFLQGVKSLLD